MTSCPGKELLFGYLVGSIPEADAEYITRHLTTCGPCEQTVQNLEKGSDTLIAALRESAPKDIHVAEPELRQVLERLRGASEERPQPEPRPTAPLAAPPRRIITLGDYELLEKLGQGGMGTVYKARHAKLKRIVAVKVLPKNRLGSPESVERFEREIEAVGRLDHPHIVRALDAREVEGVPFLVMEYVDGLDLSKVVQRVGPLSIADACEAVRQVALGLQCSHENGLVHRDIKPSNLMLTSAGEIKVLDLGLAQIQQTEGHGSQITGMDQVMGTPDYMSPEQAMESRGVDIRTDIYSLGCTLYHLLAGRPPFSGPEFDTPMKKVVAHIHKELPPIQLLRADIPRPVAATLERMLAKGLEARLATPTAVVNALASCCEGSKLIALLREARRKGPPSDDRETPGIATDEIYSRADVDTSRDSLQIDGQARPAVAEFNPYHRWLGIPPEEQPADYYRLLGIPRFETDTEVIRDAAARQMGHVRSYHLGQHAELSQKILNELGMAKACLLNATKKAAYDTRLRATMASPAAASPVPPLAPTPAEDLRPVPPVQNDLDIFTQVLADIDSQPEPRSNPRPRLLLSLRALRRIPRRLSIATACAAAAMLLGIMLYVTTGKGTVKIELSEPNAKVEVKVDGDQIEVAGLKDPLRLSVGQHQLEVTSGEFKTYTQSFAIQRGSEEILRVSLEPKREISHTVSPSATSGSQAAKSPPNPPLTSKELNTPPMSAARGAHGWAAPAKPSRALYRTSASHVWHLESVAALCDGMEPAASIDHGIPRFTWWDHHGTREWVQFDFAKPCSLSTAAVYWFDDTGRGHCRVPQSWKLLYKDGDAWKPVQDVAKYGTMRDTYNRVDFKPVTTASLRIEVQLQPKFSGGILEWTVAPSPPNPPLTSKALKAPFFGYFVCYPTASMVPEFADYTNVVVDFSWNSAGDGLLNDATKAGLSVVLGFSAKPGERSQQDRVLEMAARHRGAVSAICWREPNYDGVESSELAAFGRRLKSELPGAEFWCSFVVSPRGQEVPMPVPSEVDRFIVMFYGSGGAREVDLRADRLLGKWMERANGRPVLLGWSVWDGRPPGLANKCQPGTIRRCAQVVHDRGLAGLVVDQYGPGDGGYAGVDGNPGLVAEIRDVAGGSRSEAFAEGRNSRTED